MDLISNLSTAAQENAAMTEELTATAEGVLENVHEIENSSDTVKGAAGDLVDVINEFRL